MNYCGRPALGIDLRRRNWYWAILYSPESAQKTACTKLQYSKPHPKNCVTLMMITARFSCVGVPKHQLSSNDRVANLCITPSARLAISFSLHEVEREAF